MSVDVGVPEQRLVSIAPEELLLSDVLVLVLHGPLLVGQVSQMLPVFGVVKLDFGDRNGRQEHNRQRHVKRDLLPQFRDALRVVGLLVLGLLKRLAGLLVVEVLEWVFFDELRHVTVAVRVESLERALGEISEHFIVFLLPFSYLWC